MTPPAVATARRRRVLEACYAAGVRRVDPEQMIAARLGLQGDTLVVNADDGPLRIDLAQFRELRLLGVGKAAAPMARAVEALLGERLAGGVAVTKARPREQRRRAAPHPPAGGRAPRAGRGQRGRGPGAGR